jgi:Zn-dependent protease with chaperone function
MLRVVSEIQLILKQLYQSDDKYSGSSDALALGFGALIKAIGRAMQISFKHRVVLGLNFFLALGVISGCAGYRGVNPGTIPAPVLPSAEAQRDAKAVTAGFIKEAGYAEVPTASSEHKLVSRVSGKVLRAAGYDPRVFPVSVVDAGDEANAMVLNGSSIVVFKALVQRTDEEELAAVLAHEVGHLLGGHAALHDEEENRASTISIMSTVLGTVASVATSVAGYRGLSDIAGGLTEGVSGAVGYGTYVGSFSRAQEYEADHIGLMLMARAGYDPRRAIDFWERSEEVFGSSNGTIGAFFGTHPASESRAESLSQYLPLALGYYDSANPSLTTRSSLAPGR